MLHSQSVIVKLSHLTFIAVRGARAAEFLQGQLTCDVREVNDTQSRLAAHCNPKGRVLSTFRVLCYQDQFYLLTPASMQPLVIEQLKRYAALFKVSLEPTEELLLLGCVGNTLAHDLALHFDGVPETVDTTHSKDALRIIRILGEQPRFMLYGTADAMTALSTELTNRYPQLDSTHWRLLDIQNGIPNIYPTSRELFTPHMLNYPTLNAVSFTKGCYIGQEVVARTQYLGKTKRHLWLATLDTDQLPAPGEKLYGDKEQETGTVVDAEFITAGSCQLLAVVNELQG